MALEGQHAQTGLELTTEQVAYLQQQNPAFRFIQRFHQTARAGFFAHQLGTRCGTRREAVQVDWDQWLARHNCEQPWQGFPNQGQTPYARLEHHLSDRPSKENAANELAP